jgi:hypothetical protein
MTREFWKPVPAWEHYSVSNLGNVRSNAKGNLLKVNIDTGGYAQVKLYATGRKNWTVVVHRLVLAAFRRLPEKGEHGMHKNDVRTDNRLTNLKWGTKKQNAKDMSKKGRVRHSRCRKLLTPKEVKAIQARPKEKLAVLAEQFQTSKSNVCKIRARAKLLASNPETPIIWRTS